MRHKSDSPARFRDGLHAALPIALGYVPIAFAFGVKAVQSGLTPVEAVSMSVIIYAGAAQFLALALVAAGTPVLVAGVTLIAMNLRHLLYGPALMKRAGPGAGRSRAWLWGFGLTDEVFGAALGAMARGQAYSQGYMAGLGLLAYASWVGGTVLGVWAGGDALAGFPAVQAALGFMLPALFMAILLSILSRPQLPILGVAGVVTLAGMLWLGAAAGIMAGMLAGALSGALRRGSHED